MSIDFQRPGSEASAGAFADVGKPYGQRGDGLIYGWRRDAGPWTNRWTYDRNHPASGDQSRDTLISAGWASDLRWEIAFPPGLYNVTLTAGHANAQPGQRFVGALEGQVVLDFAASARRKFVTKTAEIEVIDGRLSLSAPDGVANTTFAGLHIEGAHDENGGGHHGDGDPAEAHDGGGDDGAHQPPGPLSSTSATTIINFEDLPAGNIGDVYTHSGGQRFRSLPGAGGNTTEALWIRGPADKYASKVLHPTNFGRKIVLDRADGTSFSLSSFDYAAGRWAEAGDAIVTGLFADGTSASATASFRSRALSTVAVNWTDLSRVEINYAGGINAAYGAVDNFVTTADDGGGGGGGGGGGDTFNEVGGRVDMEAEAFTGQSPGAGVAVNHTWSQSSDAAASAGAALVSSPNSNLNVGDATTGPRRDYAINFTNTGIYYIWVRMSGSNASDDSLHVGLDGAPASFGAQGIALAGSERGGGWFWKDRNSAGMRVVVNITTPGIHTFNLWMREDGTRVDQFILSSDPNFDPNGSDDEDDVTLGSWTTHANMPVAMMEGNVATIGENVFLWGGFNSGSTWLSQKHGYRFNTTSRTWTRIADLPAPITHAQMLTYAGRIFLFGGYANNGSWLGTTDAVYVYDPSTNQFSQWATIPYKIGGHGAAIVGTRAHLLGGYLRDDRNRFIVNSVRHVSIDMANPGAGWRNEPDVPAGRDHVAAEYADGGIYYFAGQVNDDEYTGVRANTWRFDVATSTWSSRSNVPDGGRGHIDQATTVYAGKVISVAGNINAPVLTNYSDEVFLHDPATNQWSVLGLVPDWRRGCQIAVVNNMLWVFGGGTSYPHANVWSAPLTIT